MNLAEESSAKVAEFLLQIKAVQLSPQKPFKWASGWNSPIYCDNRKTLSYPMIRNFIRQQFVQTIEATYGKPDVIAGVATGGIAQAALVAQDLGIPMIYVRPEPKGHGLTNQIEGVVESGQNVVVIEDLISTGGSSLKAVKALRDAGCNVKGLIAIFTYGFQLASDAFEENNCPFQTLSHYDALIKQAIESKHIQEKDLESLSEWRKNPGAWAPTT